MSMPGTLFEDPDSDDSYLIGPTLEQCITDNVMTVNQTERVIYEENLQGFMKIKREEADKKFQKMMKVIIILMMAILMLTIAVGYMGYVVYKHVTIVINVDPAVAGQCPVEDDFKEAPSGQTHVTEHYVFQDMFQHAYVLAMSGMKSKTFITTSVYGGFAAMIGGVVTLWVIG
jgi:hypothetical protein